MNICIRLENGEEITARTEEWVAAIVSMLPPDQRARLCESVRRKVIGVRTPGSHVLRAEGGFIGLRPGPGGG